MTWPIKEFCEGMHDHQLDLFAHFYNRRKRRVVEPQYFMCEWHRRCRKTTAAINLLIKEACDLPNSKFVYIAPTQVMARNIVWDDPMMLRHYLPPQAEMGWKLNEQKMLVKFDNGAMIKIGGADEPDSLRGIDAIGVVFDEWALIKENTWTEIFKPIIEGVVPPHLEQYKIFRWAMFIYTPKGMNHAAQMFDSACCICAGGGVLPNIGVAEKFKPNWFASRVDGEKSGIFPPARIRKMQKEVEDGEVPKSHYDQEIRCSRITVEEMTLITTEMIYKLNEHKQKTHISIEGNKRIVSIDPAWGGDVCQLYGFVNCGVEKDKSLLDKHRDTEIAMAAKVMMQELGTKNCIIDCVNDVGIAENLENDVAGYNVQRFKSSFKAKEKQASQQAIRFANRRAEAYHYASRRIATLEVGEIKDRELIRQLPIASRYTIQGGSGRLLIIPKLKLKEDLGCSPDKADTYVMGVWGSQHVEDEVEDSVGSVVDIRPSFMR